MGINSILLFQRMFKNLLLLIVLVGVIASLEVPTRELQAVKGAALMKKYCALKVSKNGRCGSRFGRTRCPGKSENQVSCSRWNWCGVSKLHRSTDQKVYHTHKCAKVVKKVTKKIVKKGKKGKVVKKRVTKKVVKKLVLKKKSAKKSAKKVTAKKSAKKVTAKKSAKKVAAKRAAKATKGKKSSKKVAKKGKKSVKKTKKSVKKAKKSVK